MFDGGDGAHGKETAKRDLARGARGVVEVAVEGTPAVRIHERMGRSVFGGLQRVLGEELGRSNERVGLEVKRKCVELRIIEARRRDGALDFECANPQQEIRAGAKVQIVGHPRLIRLEEMQVRQHPAHSEFVACSQGHVEDLPGFSAFSGSLEPDARRSSNQRVLGTRQEFESELGEDDTARGPMKERAPRRAPRVV